jgi:hypothetical protein
MKTLIYTNRYLVDVQLRNEILIRHAINSAKIEGVVNAKKRMRVILKKINHGKEM